MKWMIKAGIQRAVSRLPAGWSYEMYYWMQKRFGALKRAVPVTGLRAGAAIARRLEGLDRRCDGLVFLETGTGRRLNTPVALWLYGARRTVTVDLNPYLKDELVRQDMVWVRDHGEQVRDLLGDAVRPDRFKALLELLRGRWQLADLMELCSIEYLAPADATDLPLPDASIDCCFSFNVLEHIPPRTLRDLFLEEARLTGPEGLFVHRVDHSDHFSHTDPSISAVNFLQYSDERWQRLAGNRYMYMNRLRDDDYLALLQETGQRILVSDATRDGELLDDLVAGRIELDRRFAGKSKDVVATTSSWYVSHPRGRTSWPVAGADSERRESGPVHI